MKKIIILFVAVFSFASVKATQNDWIKSVSEKSKISFELPEAPYLQTKDLNGIYTEIYSYKDAANVYGIVASNFSSLGVDFSYSDPSDYYHEMKSGSLVTGDAILISEESVPYQKMLGKEIVYTQLVHGHEYTYYKRFFFRGKFIYQITIGGPSRMKQLLIDKKSLFFNSLQFID